LRLEKKRKEEEEHKKRMAALKAKKKVGTSAATRPKFDRSKLSAGFMTNAKSAKDEVNGWALDLTIQARLMQMKRSKFKQLSNNQ